MDFYLPTNLPFFICPTSLPSNPAFPMDFHEIDSDLYTDIPVLIRERRFACISDDASYASLGMHVETKALPVSY